MANNSNSPVFDGIWFRPYLVTANTTDTGATTDSTSTGNSINATAKVAYVKGITTNSSDKVRLPSLSDVANGHEILIICQAASNFKLCTPHGSGEKINNVNSDDTNAYLATDTDYIRLVKINNTVGWVGQSITNLGAVRTAVVPS